MSAEDGSEINKRVVRIVFGSSLTDPYTGFAVHEVVSGETLSGIAEQWHGDPADTGGSSRPTGTSWRIRT